MRAGMRFAVDKPILGQSHAHFPHWTPGFCAVTSGCCTERRNVVPMNTSELADAVAASQGVSKADAKKTVEAVFAAIADAAASGDEVSINGFGKFKVKDTPAREGRNPSTGATIQIAASRKLSFAVAKAVKDRMNG